MKYLLLVCLAVLVVFASAQPAAPPADAPADAPVDAPADAPALAPADTPVLAPLDAPADAPVEAPADAPALAPVDAPADPAPASPPADAPVAAPQLAPVAAPVQAPSEPSICEVNGCTFAMAVATANISFGGSLGAAYSPRCIRISAGDTVSWDSSSVNAFAVHPLRGGTVQGNIATPATSGPLAGVIAENSAASVTFPSAGVFPFYCSSHFDIGMKGVVYVGEDCLTGTAPAAVAPPAAVPESAPVFEDPPVAVLHQGCSFNGCTLRNIKRFGKDADYVIKFGGAEGYKYNPPCIHISMGQNITFSGDFSLYPIQGGVVDGKNVYPDGLLSDLSRTTGAQNVTVSLPEGVYPFYSPPYQSIGMYGTLYVGSICGSAASLAAPIVAAAMMLVFCALMM